MSGASAKGDRGERSRIAEAFVAVCIRDGFEGTELELVLEEAGVTLDVFHRHFEDKEDCLVSVWNEVNEHTLGRIMAAYQGEKRWREQLRAASYETLFCVMERPDEARMLLVEGPRAIPRLRLARDRMIAVLAELIDAGRHELADSTDVPRETATGIAGTIAEQISKRLARGAERELPGLLPELLCVALMPYLGVETALEEMRREPPPRRGEPSP